ncbi:hypothetical protein A3B60_02675 [Candidatus Peregrinibacteria bacterium RIFCSPLOWO2_01_FULL_39_12]|nr:MAG: hypothetical protein A3B60_02675 [Candidatus Peregrinibacteria bacterium RIFCSPLOWO2_01_FULL_39_12]
MYIFIHAKRGDWILAWRHYSNTLFGFISNIIQKSLKKNWGFLRYEEFDKFPRGGISFKKEFLIFML